MAEKVAALELNYPPEVTTMFLKNLLKSAQETGAPTEHIFALEDAIKLVAALRPLLKHSPKTQS